jgi:glycosyltransferase involved in cell wall biosynthesis
MKKVVVTLTTLPDRLEDSHPEGIKLCIDSIMNQNYVDYEIHFNIPQINKFTNLPYTIPKWLMDLGDEKLKIYRTEDLGPPTKLVPTVERVKDGDTIIVTVDDDLVYHRDMVVEQVCNQIKWPESCVGYDGLRSRNEDGSFSTTFGDARDYYFSAHRKTSLVDILQHYKSVSYKRRYFEDDYFDFVNEYYSWCDDLSTSAYFAYKKRDRVSTFHHSDEELITYDDWTLRGGVTTFPVLRHTHHHAGGCQQLREKKIDDNGSTLYQFIDSGYEKEEVT